MTQSTYSSVVLAERPGEFIIPGRTFKFLENPMPSENDLKPNQVIVENLYLSLDPTMRSWLNDTRSYMPPVKINEVMRGYSIGRILASKSDEYLVGSYVTSISGWTEIAVLDKDDVTLIDPSPKSRPIDAMGILGLTGLTAYFGVTEIGCVKSGDFVVVSGAAGATGSVACQICKILGARVLAIAGSDEKLKWLKELGCDIVLNYKAADFKERFNEETKGLIDVYYDNVGGELLEMALTRANIGARFVMCGAISQYNTSQPSGPRNIFMVIVMRIRMQGFIAFDYAKRYPEALSNLKKWLAEDKLQRRETVIKGGLKAAEQTLVDLFQGVNVGKLLLEVKHDKGAFQAKL